MTAKCPTCDGPVIEIELSSGEATLVMRSCSVCDAREWESAGRKLEIGEVLDELAASDREQRRRKG